MSRKYDGDHIPLNSVYDAYELLLSADVYDDKDEFLIDFTSFRDMSFRRIGRLRNITIVYGCFAVSDVMAVLLPLECFIRFHSRLKGGTLPTRHLLPTFRDVTQDGTAQHHMPARRLKAPSPMMLPAKATIIPTTPSNCPVFPHHEEVLAVLIARRLFSQTSGRLISLPDHPAGYCRMRSSGVSSTSGGQVWQISMRRKGHDAVQAVWQHQDCLFFQRQRLDAWRLRIGRQNAPA